MSQSASADAPELFADRPDIPSVSDVLSTVLRTVRLSGQEVTEVVSPRRTAAGQLPHDGQTGAFELPPVIAFEGLRGRGYEWFDVSYRMMAKERRDPTPGAAVMISRILDLMYIQMLRVWATSAEGSPGWLRAGMDPDVGRVLDAIHADPARAWSCAEMAQHAHLSRTTFTERFTRLLGQPPMTYLTKLRMELARDLLLGSTDAAKQIARRTGYASDAAFNRAFTKHHGRSPAQWRHEHIKR